MRDIELFNAISAPRTEIKMDLEEAFEAWERLDLIEEELRRRLVSAQAESKYLLLGLYLALETRGTFSLDLPIEDRFEFYAEATEYVDAQESANPRVRIRIYTASLLLQDGRVDEARELLEETAVLLPEATESRPTLLWALAEVASYQGNYAAALEYLDQADELIASAFEEFEARLAAGETGVRLGFERHISWRVRGTRGQVLIELGLAGLGIREVDEEWDAVEAVWRRNGMSERDEVARALLHKTNAMLAPWTDEALRATIDFVEEQLDAKADLFERVPAHRAQMLALAGEAAVHLMRVDPSWGERAREYLAAETLASPHDLRRGLASSLRRAQERIYSGDLVEADRLLASAAVDLERWSATEGGEFGLREEAVHATLAARLLLAREDATADQLRRGLEQLREVIEARLAVWEAVPLRPGGIGFLHHPPRRAWLTEAARLAMRIHGEERGADWALDLWLRVEELGSMVRRAGGRRADLAEVRERLLGERELVLVFLPAMDQSLAFCFDRERVEVFELPREALLRESRLNYVDLLAGGGFRSALGPSSGSVIEPAAWLPLEERRRAGALAAQLFPDAERDAVEWVLEHPELTIVGSELLGRVPFESLPLLGIEHLGSERAVAYLPSLLAGLVMLDRPPAETRLDYLLYAAPRHHGSIAERASGLEELPWEPAYGDKLADAFEPGRYELLDGAGASRSSLLERDLGQVAILQVLAHGFLDAQRGERPSTLVLAPGESEEDLGLFTCEDVDARRDAGLGAPLAVLLTSCRAAMGPPRLGDAGEGHLGGAFLGAGSQLVLASETMLDFAPTVEIVDRFLEQLVAGVAPAEALRRARVTVVAAGGVESPVHGGLLHVVGLGHRPLFEPAPSRAEQDPLAWSTEQEGIAPRGSASRSDSRSRFLLWGGLGLAGLALVLGVLARRGA